MDVFSPAQSVKRVLDLRRADILEEAADEANGSNVDAFDHALEATLRLAKWALIAEAFKAARAGAIVGGVGGYGAMTLAASGADAAPAPAPAPAPPATP